LPTSEFSIVNGFVVTSISESAVVLGEISTVSLGVVDDGLAMSSAEAIAGMGEVWRFRIGYGSLEA
jgi:hypothetical protein